MNERECCREGVNPKVQKIMNKNEKLFKSTERFETVDWDTLKQSFKSHSDRNNRYLFDEDKGMGGALKVVRQADIDGIFTPVDTMFFDQHGFRFGEQRLLRRRVSSYCCDDRGNLTQTRTVKYNLYCEIVRSKDVLIERNGNSEVIKVTTCVRRFKNGKERKSFVVETSKDKDGDFVHLVNETKTSIEQVHCLNK